MTRDETDESETEAGDGSRDQLDEIWGCPERLRSAGPESATHLWPKTEIANRAETQRDPWFRGEYRFERKVADRVPDCMILGEDVNRWIEFVADAPQEYRAKTREALRLGFVVHWVFHVNADEHRDEAWAALGADIEGPFSFGSFDEWHEDMELGDPLTFKNYAFPVEDMDEFRPQELLGYRRGAARIGMLDGWFDLGMFDVSGVQRRLLTNKTGEWFRAIAPGQDVEDAPYGYPTQEGLQRLVDSGAVHRLGPVRRESDSGLQ
jgi:hypothetical protein